MLSPRTKRIGIPSSLVAIIDLLFQSLLRVPAVLTTFSACAINATPTPRLATRRATTRTHSHPPPALGITGHLPQQNCHDAREQRGGESDKDATSPVELLFSERSCRSRRVGVLWGEASQSVRRFAQHNTCNGTSNKLTRRGARTLRRRRCCRRTLSQRTRCIQAIAPAKRLRRRVSRRRRSGLGGSE